jgi:hypothetical protein
MSHFSIDKTYCYWVIDSKLREAENRKTKQVYVLVSEIPKQMRQTDIGDRSLKVRAQFGGTHRIICYTCDLIELAVSPLAFRKQGMLDSIH